MFFRLFFSFQCPCASNKRQEIARREAEATEIEIQKKLAKRSEIEKEKARKEDILKKRKQKYYDSMRKSEKGM